MSHTIAYPLDITSEDILAALKSVASDHIAIEPLVKKVAGCPECEALASALAPSFGAIAMSISATAPTVAEIMESDHVAGQILSMIVGMLKVGAKAQQIADRRRAETAELSRLAALEAS